MAVLGDTTQVKVKLPVFDEREKKEVSREFTAFIAGNGPAVRTTFVRLLKERAWLELEEQRANMSGPRYLRLESSIMRDITAGKYDWGNEIHDAVMETRTGFLMLLKARLLVGTHEIPDGMLDALVEQHGWDKLVKLQEQADGIPLPNVPTPPATTDGGDTSTMRKSSAKSADASPEPIPVPI